MRMATYRAKVECVIAGQHHAEGDEFTIPSIKGGHPHLEEIDVPAEAQEQEDGDDEPLKTTDDVALAPAAKVFKPRKPTKAEPITNFLG